jgi:hypothetical protein
MTQYFEANTKWLAGLTTNAINSEIQYFGQDKEMAANLYDPLSPLHSPDERSKWQPTDTLEPIRPIFFIPRLENQPQNPILDALKLEQTQTTTKPTLNLSIPAIIPPNGHGRASEYSRSNPLGINTNISDRNVDDIWLAAASGSQTDGVCEHDLGSGKSTNKRIEQVEDVGWIKIDLFARCGPRRSDIGARSCIVYRRSGVVGSFHPSA